DLPYAQRQVGHRVIEVLLIQLAVGIVEDCPAGHAQHLAGSGKLAPAYLRQLIIRPGAPAMRCSLPGSQAKDVCFLPSLCIVEQSAPKASSLIVRMGSNTKQPKHLFCLNSFLTLCSVLRPDLRACLPR